MFAFRADAEPWAVHFGTYAEMADMYNRRHISWTQIALAPVFRGPAGIAQGGITGKAPEAVEGKKGDGEGYPLPPKESVLALKLCEAVHAYIDTDRCERVTPMLEACAAMEKALDECDTPVEGEASPTPGAPEVWISQLEAWQRDACDILDALHEVAEGNKNWATWDDLKNALDVLKQAYEAWGSESASEAQPSNHPSSIQAPATVVFQKHVCTCGHSSTIHNLESTRKCWDRDCKCEGYKRAPEADYRDLQPGEIILATDEAKGDSFDGWYRVSPHSVGKLYDTERFRRMRRQAPGESSPAHARDGD